jgi:heterodisulfide reductase subunit D
VNKKNKKKDYMIKEKGDELYACSRCGNCLAYCPVYKATFDEGFSPRGKLNLMEAVQKGKIPFTDGVSKRIYTCTTCNICAGECPSGVKIEDLLETSKTDLIDAKKYPDVIDFLKQRIEKAYNVTFDSNAGRLDWVKQIPGASPEKYLKQKCDVVYFVGCVSSFSPSSFSIPRSIVQILDAAGVDFGLLGDDEWCCGFPLISSGLGDVVEDISAHNIEQVKRRGAKTLITSCPSCFHTWSHNSRQKEEADFEILHVSQYLLRLIEEKSLVLNPLDLKVTYHDPCDLGRNSDVYEEPRKVIASIPGVELVEMGMHKKLASCCGGGGNLESLDAELAAKIGDNKAQEIADTGADVVITSCQQCVRTINSALKRKKKIDGTKVKVMDLPELVFKSINNTM